MEDFQYGGLTELWPWPLKVHSDVWCRCWTSLKSLDVNVWCDKAMMLTCEHDSIINVHVNSRKLSRQAGRQFSAKQQVEEIETEAGNWLSACDMSICVLRVSQENVVNCVCLCCSSSPVPLKFIACFTFFTVTIFVWNYAVFSAWQHAERAICYRPSVRPSVRHTGGSVENGWS